MWFGMPIWELIVDECGVPDGAKAQKLKSRAMTMTNWLVAMRLVMMCRIVMRAALVEPDGRKAN